MHLPARHDILRVRWLSFACPGQPALFCAWCENVIASAERLDRVPLVGSIKLPLG